MKFPLRLDEEKNKQINIAVFHTDAKSKHQYIIDAVMEKVKKDLERIKQNA